MIEQTGDIWAERKPTEFVVVTTNGSVNAFGKNIMGKGIAKEAALKYRGLDFLLGRRIRDHGLCVEVFYHERLIMFPVKFEWRQKADIKLIKRGLEQLVHAAGKDSSYVKGGMTTGDIPRIPGRILCPRFGCGSGRLDWEEIRPMVAHYLEENRYVVFAKERNELRKGL